MIIISFVAVCTFAMVHILSDKLRVRRKKLHRYLHSTAGGVSVAYVFAHLLPEIGAANKVFAKIGVAD